MAVVETGTCDSCGDLDRNDLVTLQRLYLTPSQPGEEPTVQVGDIERWCASCRTHYPHQMITDG